MVGCFGTSKARIHLHKTVGGGVCLKEYLSASVTVGITIAEQHKNIVIRCRDHPLWNGLSVLRSQCAGKRIKMKEKYLVTFMWTWTKAHSPDYGERERSEVQRTGLSQADSRNCFSWTDLFCPDNRR